MIATLLRAKCCNSGTFDNQSATGDIRPLNTGPVEMWQNHFERSFSMMWCKGERGLDENLLCVWGGGREVFNNR